jgi:hypothetical protein
MRKFESGDRGEAHAREVGRARRSDQKTAGDFYEVLGVPRDASAEDIRAAYLRRARLHHPDVNPGDGEAEERFKRINEAYDTLRDAGRRAEYDRTHVPAHDLLAAVEMILRRYVIFSSPAQRAAIVLWIAHAHTLEAFEVTPYLHIKSPEKECGKTRVLEVLGGLVPRPWQVVGPSEAVLFRKIERDMPTLLLDEVDNVFTGPKSKTPEAGGLRQVLNAGYRRGAVVPRCGGKNHDKLVDFSVFCAKVLAGIGDSLPDTVASRCVPILLQRRKASESVAKFKLRSYAPESTRLRDALAAWAERSVDQLRSVEPTLPEGLRDRAEEVWEPLVAIADLAGGPWPARARTAALELNGGKFDTASAGVQLLRAIKEEFAAVAVRKMLSIDLLQALVEREGEPWAGWWGKEVDQAVSQGHPPRSAPMDLASRLAPFGVIPKTVRVDDGSKGRGYDLADFADAFARYVPDVVIDFTVFASAVAEYAALASHRADGRDDETSHVSQRVHASRPVSGGIEVETPQTIAAQGLSQRLDQKPHAEASYIRPAWQVHSGENSSGAWECDLIGPLTADGQAVFDAAQGAGFPWLRLRPGAEIRPQGAVARGEAGWRLFCSTASAADLAAARRALPRGEGIA